eukprot:snap_masked-scaffold_39-processed-gene-0.20-mRNA-1 protein AED:1.00 eAED:1.00 QI:0/-1/0/0/-1/1/1/0/144
MFYYKRAFSKLARNEAAQTFRHKKRLTRANERISEEIASMFFNQDFSTLNKALIKHLGSDEPINITKAKFATDMRHLEIFWDLPNTYLFDTVLARKTPDYRLFHIEKSLWGLKESLGLYVGSRLGSRRTPTIRFTRSFEQTNFK